MRILTLASDHLAARTRVSDRAGRKVARLWREASPAALDASWDALAPQIVASVTAGQIAAARQATGYVNEALRSQGMPDRGPAIEPVAFGGADRDGMELAPMLFGAVTATKTYIGRGMGVGQAFAAGTAMMQVLAATAVQDMGRAADKTASVSRGGVVMARVVQPGACSRCAILAGVGYFTRHFERHPGCRCQTIPIYGDEDESKIPEGLFSSPGEYFNSLSRAEQDRIFTKAGAEAIRAGADEIAVVNARRGMIRNPSTARLRQIQIGTRLDGTPVMGYATVEGTTSRGAFGRRAGNYTRSASDRYRRTRIHRVMPETIMQWSKGDPNRAVQLLKHYGYIR